MRILPSVILIAAFLATVPSASAQRATKGRAVDQKAANPDGIVTRLMRFDADKDGRLTKEEVIDDRMLRLFDRADANQDGIVTKSELTASVAGDRQGLRGGRRALGGLPPGGGPGMGMRGERPRPGEVLPRMIQQRLKLTADQQAQLKDLQNEVDGKLATILTSDQKSQLEELVIQGPPGGPPPGAFGEGGGALPGDFGGEGGPPPPPDF